MSKLTNTQPYNPPNRHITSYSTYQILSPTPLLNISFNPSPRRKGILTNASRRVDIAHGALDQATAGSIAYLATIAIVLLFEGLEGAQGVRDGAGGDGGEGCEGDEEGFEVHVGFVGGLSISMSIEIEEDLQLGKREERLQKKIKEEETPPIYRKVHHIHSNITQKKTCIHSLHIKESTSINFGYTMKQPIICSVSEYVFDSSLKRGFVFFV